MSNYIYNVYFKLNHYEARVYNSKTKEITTMNMSDVYKLKKRYAVIGDYEPTDEGLKIFLKDFISWVSEIRNNDIFKFEYLKHASHPAVAIDLFKRLCHEKYEDMEDIDQIEYKWIESCNNAGLQYCKPGTHECYGYDYSSQFPSILASQGLYIPTRRGKEMTIEDFEFVAKGKRYLKPILKIGYYKVKITSKDERFNKVFNYSNKHVYTNTSLSFAYICKVDKKFDVNIELVKEENNCYIYGNNRENGVKEGSKIFYKWFSCLSKLKTEFPKNKLVKYMISALWGRLCQYNRKFITETEIIDEQIDAVNEFNPKHEYYIRDMKYSNKKKDYINELISCKQPYHYNIARIKPFLLSKSRSMTGKKALEYIDDVVRIHTDNVTFNKRHDDISENERLYKIVKEEKTTGTITFKNAGCYKNHTNPKYTTKNYNKTYRDCDDEIDDDECLF